MISINRLVDTILKDFTTGLGYTVFNDIIGSDFMYFLRSFY